MNKVPHTPDLFDEANQNRDAETLPGEKSSDEHVAPSGAGVTPPGHGDGGGFDAGATGDGLALDRYAEQAYLSYAMSVVKSRALPQVEDGLKPVQRRILFAMNEMRLAASSKHVKSARVVGDVIGKYHPHGDTSVYDAMVRVAQDFSLRYPLVDGQGNFGSRDGDGAAAMRYTECRLTPIAQLLLSEINQGTVGFLPNYDGTLTEPELLPARLPFVLLNGASGIAVGMATEIPPHNLREVCEALKLLIRRPEADLDDVLALLPGPDFPGGGQLISAAGDIREAYASGRGSLRMRARWHVEELARCQWRVIVDQLPHGVSTAQVLSEIEAVINPQPRTGKKELSQEQKNLKQVVLGVLDSVRDESNEAAPVRIVLEPRSARLGRDEFMAVLLVHTSLEAGVSLNMTMIGRDGRPRQMPLLDILKEWLAFRHATVERRCQHRLTEVERRLHILEGRLAAFLRIEEVIRCIREADEPKEALIREFGLTAIQAEDILEIRLRQLARLEGIKIQKESAELREEAAGLRKILADGQELTRLVQKEISDDARLYGDKDPRRTLIEAVAVTATAEVTIPDEPVTVILSQNGWVRTRQGHGIDPAGITYKTGDFPFAILETRSIWPLAIIDHHGRAYSVRVGDLPGGRGDGVPLSTLIEYQEGGKMAQALSNAPDVRYLFANTGGYGFIASIGDLISRQRAGKAFMSLDKSEKPLPPARITGDTVAAVSASGRLLILPLAELKEMARGRGLMIQSLADNDEMAGIAVGTGTAFTIQGNGRGGKAQEWRLTAKDMTDYRGPRGRKGRAIPSKIKPLAVAATD